MFLFMIYLFMDILNVWYFLAYNIDKKFYVS